MASTLSQKMVNDFLPKAQNFVDFVPYDFVKISQACGPNSYQIMHGETLDSNVSVSNGNLKCPIGKSIFAVNLQVKLFYATVSNADTGSLKAQHTLFDTYLDHILARFKPNCMVRIVQKDIAG